MAKQGVSIRKIGFKEALDRLLEARELRRAPELPTQAAPLSQQALEALSAGSYGVVKEVLRLLLEEGEGPTEELVEAGQIGYDLIFYYIIISYSYIIIILISYMLLLITIIFILSYQNIL